MRLMRRAVVPVLGGLLVMASVAGWGRAAGQPVGAAQQASAARAVTQLTAAGSDGALMPADFAGVSGYRPVRRAGHLLRADGGCSSPFGPTAFGFGDACRAHDLGYDLLRYAADKGQPLGPWARRAVDDSFDRALHARCTSTRCDVVATVYADAVRFNSWRQGLGVPVAEGPGRTLLGLAAGMVVALLLASGTGRSARPLPSVTALRPRPTTTAPARGVVLGAQR